MIRRLAPAITTSIVIAAAGCAPGPVALHRLSGRTFGPFAPPAPPPPIDAGDASPDELDRMLAGGMDELVRESAATGGAVAIVREGSLVLAEGFGTTTRGGEPVTADTLFRIGSVGKIFTAVALLRAAREGILDLDAPVAETFPELDERITARMLLSHTAGIADAGGCEPGLDTPTAYAEAHAGDALWSPPGAFFNYSNAGMTYAGALLEVRSGRDFSEYVETEIFRRAGMESATYDPAERVDRPHALGHDARGVAIEDDPPCGLVRAAGGAYASARELVLFATAMMDGSILSAEDMNELLAPRADTDGSDRSHYGLGVFLRRQGPLLVAYHPGGMRGWSAILGWIPERRFAVAALVNAPGVGFPFRPLDLYFPSEPAPEEAALDLDAFAGTYRDPHGWLGRLRVEVREGGLVLVPLGVQQTWPIPVPATFWPDERGRIHYLATRIGVAVRDE